MTRHGLLESRKDRLDERRRLVWLTKRGEDLISQLEPLWKLVREETEHLLDTTAPRMIDLLSQIEAALADRDMYTRVRERLKQRQMSEIEILPYRSEFKQTFRRLNLEWLREHFAAEEEDERILRDPEGVVIRPGGAILMAKLDGRIVGTTALIHLENSVCEIAKMAVTRSVRGRCVGRRLTLAALELAEQMGAARVILHTSPKLTAALNLYKSLGFQEGFLEPELARSFRRPTITMQLNLSPKKRRTRRTDRRKYE
jgi:ribosomal protein S18 acetylase RimI-like enzyme